MRPLAFGVCLAIVAASPGASAEELRGWIGVGGRNTFGLGSPMYPDFGVYAIGGVWLLGEHLQPFVRAGWARGPGVGVTIDTLRTGAGLAAGWALAREHVWLGGAAAVEAVTLFSESDSGTTTSLQGMFSLSALVQVRIFERFLVGVEAGPDFYPLPLSSSSGMVEWDVVRLTAGLRLGVILGRRVPN